MSEVGCVRVRCSAAVDPEVVADRCWGLGATAIGEQVADEGTVLEVGFGSDDEARAAAAALIEAWPGIDVEVVDAGPALEAALDAWKAYARPVRVGRLHVRPAWLDADDDPPGRGEVPVVVDPSRAFGYDHPSTLLCLAEVDRGVAPGTRVLDIGCGSGVLAVAAARLGAPLVVALDIDPAAVDATRRGAALNGVGVEVSAGAVGEERRPFDVVLANIGAATLTSLAPAVAARVAAGGVLVLGGLLAEQVPAVVAAYEREGLDLCEVGERSGWATPVFLRKSTFSRPGSNTLPIRKSPEPNQGATQ